MGIVDWLVDLLARAMDAVGLNGTRLRWKWSQRRTALREGGVRASVAFRSARGKHKMCPSCRALVPRGARRCPECGATLAGVRAPGLSRMLSNVLPGATMTTSLILLANGFWFVLMMMAVIRETDSGGFLSMLIFPRGSGEILVRFGALWSPAFSGPGDWWRLIPPIFLHGGLLHFFFNSFVFLQLAPIVEQEYGTERFFVAYLVSGILGFLFSQAWVTATGGVRLTLGASGAVLGLMGLLIAYGIRRGGPAGQRIRSSMLRYVVFIFVISLVMGGNIDHTAHAGGLAGGFLIGMVMPSGPYRSRRQEALWQFLAVVGILLVLYAFYRVARQAVGA